MRQPVASASQSAASLVGKSCADATDGRLRDIIEKGKFTDLNVNTAFTMADFKAVPKEWRDRIPEYVKDYVPLNQFMQ